MPRHKYRESNKPAIDINTLVAAVKDIAVAKKSLRTVEKKYKINKSKLSRYISKLKADKVDPTTASDEVLTHSIFMISCRTGGKKVFSIEEEEELMKYLVHASSSDVKLTINKFVAIAYEFAKKLGADYPEEWGINGKASRDWYYAFMHRHQNLVRKRPELSSKNSVVDSSEDEVGATAAEIANKLSIPNTSRLPICSDIEKFDPLSLDSQAQKEDTISSTSKNAMNLDQNIEQKITMEERLIQAIRSNSCLYDKKRKSYKNKMLQSKAWQEVASVVGEKIDVCQARWKSLRDRFAKETTKYPRFKKAVKENSTGAYMELLDFLRDHIEPCREQSDSESAETLGAADSFMFSLFEKGDEPCYESPCTSAQAASGGPKKRRRTCKPTATEESIDHLDKLNAVANHYPELKKEVDNKGRNDDFYKVLESYLTKMSDDDQDDVKMEVLNFVHAKYQQLKGMKK